VISFNDVIASGGFNLTNVRLMRHQESGSQRGRTVYELWRDQRSVFDEYQTQHSADKHRTLRTATHWASFVATPDDETLFAGLYRTRYLNPSTSQIIQPTTGKVWESGEIFLYEVVLEPFLSEYIGRLFIDWGVGNRAWVQLASRKVKPIAEIKRRFEEDVFPGFLNFVSDLSRLTSLPAGWKAALSAARGVYVLTCPKTHELYIGSATGADGFFGRWTEYARDGHGGNVRLKSRERSDYQIAILEVAGTSMTTQEIQYLESHWKGKLQSKKMGLNSN
jgi:hypothetical protein